LLGDTVESVREFDARTQRSISPVQRTTLLPLTEWSVRRRKSGFEPRHLGNASYFGPSGEPGPSTLFELQKVRCGRSCSSMNRKSCGIAAEKHLTAATENYERHGHANSPAASHYFWSEAEFAAALEKTSQIHIEQLALGIGSTPQFELSSRPSARFHGDVVALYGRT